MKPRREASPWLSESFQGEAAWRWHKQFRYVAHIASPARALTVAVTVLVWRLAPQPPGAHEGLVAAIALAAVCYVPLDLFMSFRRPDLAVRCYRLQGIVDQVFIVSWVILTGESPSLALPLLFLGLMLGALRLPPRASVALALAYGGLYFALAHGAQRFGAVYMLLGAWVLSFWVAEGLRDQRDSLRDELTGCYGRRYALFQLDEMLARGKLPLSVGLVDLDGFKEVNDGHGHEAGDTVLRESALLMAVAVREGDLLARYGGDEFLVLWPEADAAEAHRAAERLRTAFDNATFHLRQPRADVRLTASVGVAVAHRPCPAAELLRAADANLYRAKETRNRVVSRAGSPE